MADHAQARIEFPVFKGIHFRTQLHLMRRILAQRLTVAEIVAPRFQALQALHPGKAEVQPPPVRHPILAPGFDAIGVAGDAVAQLDRNDGHRIGKGGADIVILIVVKRG
jgi:hypothetical protein